MTRPDVGGAGTASTRHVWVLRHAKAVPAEPGGDDHSRGLTGRGRRQGESVRRRLHDLRLGGHPVPTLVLCSTAQRARETADLVLPGLGAAATLHTERWLYGAEAEDVVQGLRVVPDEVGSVMVVGHNPTLHEVCFELLGPVVPQGDDATGEEEGRRRLDRGLPTAGLVAMDADIAAWADLAPGAATLAEFFVPER